MFKNIVSWLRQDNDVRVPPNFPGLVQRAALACTLTPTHQDQPREKHNGSTTPNSANNDLYDSTSDPEQASDPAEVRQQKSQYPEGGRAANLVVFGSFCAIMGASAS